MKPIERIALYLQFKSIAPYAFERKINLSNGYIAKQLKHNGSVGSDILIRICEVYPELNIKWLLTGEGSMISSSVESVETSNVDEFVVQYEVHNKKLKSLELDLEKLSHRIMDKDKIIGLYEFMLNNRNHAGAIGDML